MPHSMRLGLILSSVFLSSASATAPDVPRWDGQVIVNLVREVFLAPLGLEAVVLTIETAPFAPAAAPDRFIVHVLDKAGPEMDSPQRELIQVRVTTEGSLVVGVGASGEAVEAAKGTERAAKNRERSVATLKRILRWREVWQEERRGGGTVIVYRDATGEILPWNRIVFWEGSGLPRVVGSP